MFRHYFIVCIILLNAFHAFAMKGAVPPTARVLIFGKTLHPAHAQIVPVVLPLLQTFFLANGYAVDTATDSATFNAENLKNFAAVVLFDVSEGILAPEQGLAIQHYVEKGGGLMAVHASIALGKDWPWYRNALGALFSDHPPIQEATVIMKTSEKKTRTDLPVPGVLTWKQSDEWYNFTTRSSPGQLVVATVDETTYSGGKMGKDHAITWAKKIGNGRVWYTAMGHAISLYEDPQSPFALHLLEGLKSVTDPATFKNLVE